MNNIARKSHHAGLSEILEAHAAKVPGVLGACAGVFGRPPAAYRAEEKFPAASLIKIPILVYLLKEKDRGKADLNETVLLRDSDKVGGCGVLPELHAGIPLSLLDLAALMIVVSDNTATNLLMERLGTAAIQAFIKETGLRQTVLARKLMIAPEAPPANFTSPADMYDLFSRLVSGDLLSAESTRLCLDILCRQQYNEKIPLFLPKETRVAHKTGEITGVRHDCGVVDPEGKKIILCFLTKDLRDELKADRAIAELSAAVCRNFGAAP